MAELNISLDNLALFQHEYSAIKVNNVSTSEQTRTQANDLIVKLDVTLTVAQVAAALLMWQEARPGNTFPARLAYTVLAVDSHEQTFIYKLDNWMGTVDFELDFEQDQLMCIPGGPYPFQPGYSCE